MIDSSHSEVETVRRQERRPPTVDEIIEKAKRGIIDDSMATALLAELEEAQTGGETGSDEVTDRRRQASA